MIKSVINASLGKQSVPLIKRSYTVVRISTRNFLFQQKVFGVLQYTFNSIPTTYENLEEHNFANKEVKMITR